jgi:hypothetical protein
LGGFDGRPVCQASKLDSFVIAAGHRLSISIACCEQLRDLLRVLLLVLHVNQSAKANF